MENSTESDHEDRPSIARIVVGLFLIILVGAGLYYFVLVKKVVQAPAPDSFQKATSTVSTTTSTQDKEQSVGVDAESTILVPN
jgi:hypothetical protein